MAIRISRAFANSGDKNSVPDESLTTEVSFETGWSDAYELNIGDPGYREIDRFQHNYLWYVITQNLKQWQDGLYPSHVPSFDYPVGSTVVYGGESYTKVSNADGGVTFPTNSNDWLVYSSSRPIYVNSMSELNFPGFVGRSVIIGGYHSSVKSGGGTFAWSASARHDGGINIDPARTFPTDWNDESQKTAWFLDSGLDVGCWTRTDTGEFMPQMFGSIGNSPSTDSHQSVQKMFEYVFNIKTDVPLFNASQGGGGVAVSLGGQVHHVGSPVIWPSTGGGGGMKINNGTLKFLTTAPVNRYVIEANADIDWFINIDLKIDIDASHIAGGGCVRAQRWHNCDLSESRFIGWESDAVLIEAPSSSNRVTNIDAYQYVFGETGFDVETNKTGTAFNLKTSDVILKGVYAANCLDAFKTNSGNIQCSLAHVYGLAGYAIDDSSGSNDWSGLVLDTPAACRFTHAPMYNTKFHDNNFTNVAPRWGAMVYLKPTIGSVNLANGLITGNTFQGARYSVGSAIPLSLGSTAKGKNVSVSTSPFAWFEPRMIGATIRRISGPGALRITTVNSVSYSICEIVEAFDSTSISAGDWQQLVTSVFIDETDYPIADIIEFHVKDNIADSDQIVNATTEKKLLRYIENKTSTEIEFGIYLIKSDIQYGWPYPINGNPATQIEWNNLYSSGSVVAVSFGAAFTGELVCDCYLSKSYQYN